MTNDVNFNNMRKYIKLLIFIFIFTFIISIVLISGSYSLYSNSFHSIKESSNVIPNIIHYINFEKHTIEFFQYLSILSAIKFQKPRLLYIHSNVINFTGTYWDKLKEINKTYPIITINYISKPTHVYGQLLSSTFHATDVARIQILQQWGGIYIDADTVILKNLNKFRHYEMVVGWPKNEYMGTQILLAKKYARFLTAWLEGYKRYVPSKWYYNAGQYPTEQVLEKMPHLAHRVPDLFGVQNLLEELYKSNNWSDWKQYYAIHLLSRHPPAPQYLNETLVNAMNNTFKDIARYILFT